MFVMEYRTAKFNEIERNSDAAPTKEFAKTDYHCPRLIFCPAEGSSETRRLSSNIAFLEVLS